MPVSKLLDVVGSQAPLVKENFAKSDPGRRTPDPKSAEKCLFSLVSFTLFFLQLPLFSLKTDPRTAKALDFRVVNHPFFPQLPFFSPQIEMLGLLGAHAPPKQAAVSQMGVQFKAGNGESTVAGKIVAISALNAYLTSTQGTGGRNYPSDHSKLSGDTVCSRGFWEGVAGYFVYTYKSPRTGNRLASTTVEEYMRKAMGVFRDKFGHLQGNVSHREFFKGIDENPGDNWFSKLIDAVGKKDMALRRECGQALIDSKSPPLHRRTHMCQT